MGTINETNAQYYSGQSVIKSTNAGNSNVFEFGFSPNTGKGGFNTNLVNAYGLPLLIPANTYTRINPASNFRINNLSLGTIIDEDQLYVSNSFTNEITLRTSVAANTVLLCQLDQNAINTNYGGYSFIPLNDVIDNFMIAYVGDDKLILSCKRTDVIFHAKRVLQELSYDVLKVIKSQELTIPPNLSVPIPQDYVNLVSLSWADSSGVMHPIYPLNGLSGNPLELPIQDTKGVPTQDSFEENINADQSIIEQRWAKSTSSEITGDYDAYNSSGVFDYVWWKQAYGQRYGLNPGTSQDNGWYSLNERTGTFSFSSSIANRCIVLEYVSDGLAYDDDMKIPKVVEDAMYASIMYNILSTRRSTNPSMIQLYKREKYAKTRNAKIRLQDLNLETLTQTFRNQSKWIKH